ncbi:MAG: NAD(P)-dependent oxidoreductase [Tabrizicola sp.]|uniref:NAD-dependent epimerase/dehydratase family protein n=1 Tax=Tabrizicola sp. TaxID=2005166 RepID=UPI0027358B3B|nr:NAD(P)-dependent oxidoreductase [Tabrizicola sp.]MDP3261378.1 NAD(P)-dependent oxidoreductase [Tabrizicola sp.]MDP3649167.1 NAD(P)-dependent oxidoreductase [Paracoccaceae bacterium]MDZ4069601.1 NAD(P)-dependent oxidoreductase [Tabrizicola sp.]
MRVLFTGGSGKAGKHVVAYLAAAGHRVLNFDRVGLGHPGVHDLIGDITDAGQVYSAMRTHAGYDEMESPAGAQLFDAVVHFAAVPRHLMMPDTETYRVNVMGTYNVLEAALKMGVRKVIVASSETTYGVCFSDGEVDPKVLPLEEDYDIDPMDSYGMSKKVNEVTARSFQRRFGADVYALRIGNVIEPHEYATVFPPLASDPGQRRRITFSYIDARDLGQIVDLCLKTDGLGFQVFNAVNDTNSVPQPNSELLPRFFPNVPLSRPVSEEESLLSNRKIR